MAIGSAVILFVLGAILAFGVEAEVQGLNLEVIGQILMIAGAIGGVLGLIMWGSSRNRTSTQEVHRTADGGEVVHTEHRV